MLACPHCRKPLDAARFGFGLAWRCPACGGHAANFSVLRVGLPEARWDHLRRAVAAGRGESGAPCPSCRNASLRIEMRGHELDACRRCQVVWFDPGELPSAAPQRPALTPAESTDLRALRAARAKQELTRLQLLCAWLGLPYELDEQARTFRPWATVALTALVLALGVWALFDLDRAVARFGFRPSDPWREDGLTLLSYFFVHAGVLHLFGNAYFLAVFGDNVEEALGRASFLVVVIFGTVLSAFVHGWLDPRADVPLVGASGGVSALLVCYALSFPRARIGWAFRLWFVPVWFFDWPAWGAFLLWLGWQGVLALLQAHQISAVSAFGHLGGVAAGALFWTMRRTMNA